jgi:hypothetical protein
MKVEWDEFLTGYLDDMTSKVIDASSFAARKLLLAFGC